MDSTAWRDNSMGLDDSPNSNSSTSIGASPPDINAVTSEGRYYGSSPSAASTAQAAAALYPDLQQTYIRYDHVPPVPARRSSTRDMVVPICATSALNLSTMSLSPPRRPIVRTRRCLDDEFDQLANPLGAVGDRPLVHVQSHSSVYSMPSMETMAKVPPPTLAPSMSPFYSHIHTQFISHQAEPKECKFCRNNGKETMESNEEGLRLIPLPFTGEERSQYRSHALRNPATNILTCPVRTTRQSNTAVLQLNSGLSTFQVLRRHICEVRQFFIALGGCNVVHCLIAPLDLRSYRRQRSHQVRQIQLCTFLRGSSDRFLFLGITAPW